MTMRKLFQALFASAMLLVALSAFGVSSAAASTTEECKIPEGEELFTSQHFADSNCKEKTGAEGLFHTTLVGESSILKITKTSPIFIEIEITGVPVEMTCETLSGTSTVSNYEEGAKHGFKGEGNIQLSSCTVNKPVGCTVKPIESVALNVSSEDLEKEVLRTLFAPKEGTKFATVTLSGCAVAGTYSVEGKLRSQAPNINSEEFTATSGSELTVGKKPAMITGTYHEATAANGKTIVRELP
jgi:hypothetical protein